MKKNNKLNPFTHRSAIILTLIDSIILDAILMIGYSYNQKIIVEHLEIVLSVFISNGLLLYLLFRFNFLIIETKRGQKLWLWISFLGSLVFSYIYNVFYCSLASKLFPTLNGGSIMFSRTTLMTEWISVLVVLLTTYLLTAVYENQQNLIKNEKLIAENIRIRYEVLKSQVDPHFLFNSLNTLDGLISLDSDKAHDYVQNLSSVFRYAIGNKEIMHLDDEMNFTESYANLMKIRYGENLQIRYNIDVRYRTYFIMPISLQLLVENAIKHNVISSKQPLVIHIETTLYDTIKVWNVVQPKNEVESGEGIGLANLTERYKLLFDKEVLITKADIFCVEIPLIKELDTDKITIENEYHNDWCYRRR